MNFSNIPFTTAATSSSTQSNSIDKLTISYLKGEMSFQQYENLIENQHLQVDLVRSRLNETNSLPTEVVTTNTPTNKNSPSKRKHSTNSLSSNDEKRSKIKDRFLNLKDILGEDIIINDDEEDDDDDDEDDEDDDENNDDEEESTQGDDTNMSDNSKQKNQIRQKKTNKLMEEFIDETSNWTDFDIETLNFDKFIKDHQTSFSSPTKGSSNKIGNNKRKRGGDDEQNSAQSQSPGGTTSDLMGELKAKRRRNRVLPIEIQGLMGEANLNYARGETNKAIDTCLEVIKYAPKASEPYQLLSLLYSEMGQNDKALRVGLIAAQLNKDADEWIGLIQQAVIEGDVELVLFCYNNAIQCNPKNIELHVERIRLLKERKDTKRLFLARLMLLRYVDINTSLNVYNEHFQQIMSELDSETDKQKKIYVLKNDMKKFQENFSVESKHLF
jgi:tetratricopeptide (TPR) repeat protein